MFGHTHQLAKPLTGANGYKRLVRLVARTFYSGECPPKELEEPGAPQPFRTKQKHDFPGLGVIAVDLLASCDGYVDEDDICKNLRLSQKNVRKVLRYLETESLLTSQDVKVKKPRQPRGGEPAAAAAGASAGKAGAAKGAAAAAAAAAAAGDEEEEQVMRKETRVFWCVDYPRLRDTLWLRLHRLREFVREQVQDKNPLQDYLCPACGARYSSLDAIRLLDPMLGVFRCEECKGELVQHVEGGKVADEGGRKANAAHYKALQARMEAQLKPVVEQLEKIKDIDPPDYGSLQEWIAEQGDQRKQAEKREAAAAARAAAGAAGGRGERQRQQQPFESAEVQFNFGGTAAAAEAAPAKEMPAWFRAGMGQASGLASNTTTSDATVEPADPRAAAAAAAEEAERAERERLIKEQYIAAYMADLRRREAAEAGGGGEFDDKKDVKRVKMEDGWAAAGAGGEVKPEPKLEPKLEAVQALEQQQQQQQADVGEDEFGWEDVDAAAGAAADGGVGGGGGGAAAGGAPATRGLGLDDEDFAWEDA